MKLDKILVIPGQNEAAQPGVSRLLALAGPDAKIEVFEPVFNSHLEAYPLDNQDDYERLRDELVRDYRERAGRVAGAIAGGGLSVSGTAGWDYPRSDAIVRRALETNADLVITEPLAGRAGTLSHTDWRLVSRCPVPLLLVRSTAESNYANVVAAVDPFHEHGKPGDLDAVIIDAAATVSAATQAQLKVLHCFVPLASIAQGADLANLPIDEVENSLSEYRRDALMKLVAGAGLGPESASLERGRPANVIERLIESGDADLVVMGALSRGRIRDFLIGSTAEQLLDGPEADLLFVKPRDFQTTVADRVDEPPIVAPVYYPF
jgi:universal stress protein E